ncbi:hypothetical protein EDP1_1713 [Pseudomonas putida S610]|nr:hypothetical protein EDP1_1713 [Pseudomonas putida S610]
MPRISKAGELDPTFASRGRFWHDQYNHAGPMALLKSTGQILLSSAHRAEQYIKLLRLEAGGAPDREFGTDGVATVEYTGALRVFLSTIVTDETEGIYVVGDYNYAPNSLPRRLSRAPRWKARHPIWRKWAGLPCLPVDQLHTPGPTNPFNPRLQAPQLPWPAKRQREHSGRRPLFPFARSYCCNYAERGLGNRLQRYGLLARCIRRAACATGRDSGD